MKLLACIDGEDRAAHSVLATTKVLATALGAGAEALHVCDAPCPEVEAFAHAADLPFRLEHGDTVATIARAVDDPACSIAVVGIRDAGGPTPGGHIALPVLALSSKPIVAVPPEGAMTKLQRILVPLDGPTDPRSMTVVTADLLANARVNIVAMHVFDRQNAPPIFDRPEHDIDVWAAEFLARHRTDRQTQLELRTGDAGMRILDVAHTERVDLIALAWHQDLSPGHAMVIRRVLSGATLPVMLVPVAAVSAGHPASAEEMQMP